jgi:hypothetical protein
MGAALASTLASSFCIAKSSSALINGVADLPGPGAVTLKGTASLSSVSGAFLDPDEGVLTLEGNALLQ